jgi:hypothetical protein
VIANEDQYEDMVIASGWSAPSGRPLVLPKTYGTAKWERGPARSRQLVKALS